LQWHYFNSVRIVRLEYLQSYRDGLLQLIATKYSPQNFSHPLTPAIFWIYESPTNTHHFCKTSSPTNATIIKKMWWSLWLWLNLFEVVLSARWQFLFVNYFVIMNDFHICYMHWGHWPSQDDYKCMLNSNRLKYENNCFQYAVCLIY